MLIALWSFFALNIIVFALFALFTRKLMHAAFALLAVFLSVAALFVLSNATFVAVSQLLLYVGGILVMLVFGIMLTQRENAEAAPQVKTYQWFSGIMLSAGLFLFLIYAFNSVNFGAIAAPTQIPQESLPQLGAQLITKHLISFELVGILLLAALIGAAVLSHKPTKSSK
jgi:NADH-quinone oxidoreductase subunit J